MNCGLRPAFRQAGANMADLVHSAQLANLDFVGLPTGTNQDVNKKMVTAKGLLTVN
jgi:hypothetical protein